MNDRQSSDFPAEREQKMRELQAMIAELPANTPTGNTQQLQQIVTALQTEKTDWRQRRLQSAARQFGGSVTDYDLISVPPEEERTALKAGYIRFDGKKLIYQKKPPFIIQGTTITVPGPRWVKGNYRLETDDVTDFADIQTETNFALSFYLHDIDKMVSVELFLWSDEEDRADKALAGKTFLSDIVIGVVHVNPVFITLT
jgi:hypothetical protein